MGSMPTRPSYTGQETQMPLDPNDPFALETEPEPKPALTASDVEGLFDGETYSAERDGHRLLRQSQAVRAVLLGSRAWMSTPEIRSKIGAEDNLAMDVTARIRDLRKSKHGDHRIESRPRAGTNGLWEYRHSLYCHCLGGDQHGEPKTPPFWFEALSCSHPRHTDLMAWVRGLLARGKHPKAGLADMATTDELVEMLEDSL